MRSLHPVGAHEKFIASGVYKHFERDKATGTLERWSIHELPDQSQIIRVDDDWREHDGSSVLIEAWRNPEGIIERFDLHAFGGKQDEIKDVRATYSFSDGFLQLGRTVDKGERQQDEVKLPENYIVSPKSLIFSGLEVAQLATTPEAEQIIISYFPTFLDADTAFKPVSYKQSVHYLGDEIILDLASKPHHTRLYEHRSVASATPVWLDRHGILIKFTSGLHSAYLSQYALRPD